MVVKKSDNVLLTTEPKGIEKKLGNTEQKPPSCKEERISEVAENTISTLSVASVVFLCNAAIITLGKYSIDSSCEIATRLSNPIPKLIFCPISNAINESLNKCGTTGTVLLLMTLSCALTVKVFLEKWPKEEVGIETDSQRSASRASCQKNLNEKRSYLDATRLDGALKEQKPMDNIR